MPSFPAPPRLHVLHVPGADPERDLIVAAQQGQADVCLHTDPSRRGVMPTWLDALECAGQADTGYSWSVIVQDDALPLRGWAQHLERACLASPHPVLGLTHFGGYGLLPLEKGAPYAEGPYLLWGAAIAYHRALLPGLLTFATRVYETTGYVHDDVLAAAYAMRTNHHTAMTARAIFDQPVKRSLLGHNTPIRRPSSTIESHEGPEYTVPKARRAVRVGRSINPRNELERLAAL